MVVSVVLNSQAHLVTMACTLALLVKYLLTLAIQGSKRFPAGTRPPEDAVFKNLTKGTPQNYGLQPQAGDASKTKKAKEDDIRWQRIVSNDLESIPVGLLVAWGSLLSPYIPLAHSALVITFVVARVLHTIFYANSLQPHRALAWFLGVFSIILLAVNGLLGVVAK